jgi:hypothetical protein
MQSGGSAAGIGSTTANAAGPGECVVILHGAK